MNMDWLFGEDGPTFEEMAAASEACATAREETVEAVKRALVENACGCWDALGQHMVGKLVVVAEVIDENGEPHLNLLVPEEQAQWETVGMMGYATQLA